MSVTIHRGENCHLANTTVLQPRIDKSISGQTVFFRNAPKIVGRMSVVGEKEGKGPMGGYFHKIENDCKMGEKTFEKAEIRMLEDAIEGAVINGGLSLRDVQMLISGDLLNQMTSSSYVARTLNMPHLGLYSACSTMTESLALGACLIDAGYFDTVACATVSHFATAERQYRFPLEYGCQRPPYAQWTVTGAGCSVLSNKGEGAKITAATFGKVIDYGVTDINNLGASMAPAAYNTLLTLFKDTDTVPDDYDLIITGDLGKLGSDILRELMSEQGYVIGNNYMDCGNIIYAVDQNCYQGGSGAGCSASVVNSFVLEKMEERVYKKVLFLATGALMSPQSCFQGETIPCISHAVIMEA